MNPNFQGLLWDDFGGLGEDELRLFQLEDIVAIFIFNHWAPM